MSETGGGRRGPARGHQAPLPRLGRAESEIAGHRSRNVLSVPEPLASNETRRAGNTNPERRTNEEES